MMKSLSTQTTSSSSSLVDVLQKERAEFVAAVKLGMDTLMSECGYSRDRAINVLLRELLCTRGCLEGGEGDNHVTVSSSSSIRQTNDSEVCESFDYDYALRCKSS
jgi:hypothetical protein